MMLAPPNPQGQAVPAIRIRKVHLDPERTRLLGIQIEYHQPIGDGTYQWIAVPIVNEMNIPLGTILCTYNGEVVDATGPER